MHKVPPAPCAALCGPAGAFAGHIRSGFLPENKRSSISHGKQTATDHPVFFSVFRMAKDGFCWPRGQLYRFPAAGRASAAANPSSCLYSHYVMTSGNFKSAMGGHESSDNHAMVIKNAGIV